MAARQRVSGEENTKWKIGDRIIVTVSKETENGGSSYRQSVRRPRRAGTEERLITATDGVTLTMDKPLAYEHFGTGITQRSREPSRNVIIESADPNRVRDHTMYHRDSGGGISYAEFRHLGKEGVLGKYSIHFHLVGDTMRGSGVLGVSIWDSHQSQAHPIAENCCARGRAHPSGTWGSYRCLTMPGPF